MLVNNWDISKLSNLSLSAFVKSMYKLPPFPVDSFPKSIKEYVEAVAESSQTPPDLAASMVLAVAGTAMAQSFTVSVNPDWHEPCNLFLAVAMPPASRKSAVFKEVTKPIRSAELRAKKDMAPLLEENQHTRQIQLKKIKKLEGEIIKATDDDVSGKYEEIKSIRAQLPVELKIPRLVVDDISPEALASLLAANNGKLAIMSAEGGIMDIIAGRYNKNGPNLDVFLKGHAGDTIHVDRQGRGPDYVESPTLIMGLAVQPDFIEGMAIGNRGFLGRGFLARFLWGLPRSTVGFREIDPVPVNPRIRVDYENLMAKLFRPWKRAVTNEETSQKTLILSPQAQSELRKFREETEISLRPHGKLYPVADWGGKLPGAVVRMAALLHGLAHPDLPAQEPISGETMLAAIAIGRYFEDHAIAAYTLMGVSTPINDALHILRWMIKQQSERYTLRDIHQALKGTYTKVDDLWPGLTILLRQGLIVKEVTPQIPGPGRKPGPVFVLMTDIDAQNSQNPLHCVVGRNNEHFEDRI